MNHARNINHIHKFKKFTYKSTGNKVFFCTLPDCNFKIGVEFALGKRCLCNRCNEPFLLSTYGLQLAKPHCEKCHVRKDGTNDRRFKAADRRIANQISQQTTNDLKNRLSASSAVAETESESDDDVL